MAEKICPFLQGQPCAKQNCMLYIVSVAPQCALYFIAVIAGSMKK
jgi:hypothetical protein